MKTQIDGSDANRPQLPRSEGHSLTSSVLLVYPSTIDVPVGYSSPAVRASDRNEKLSPGETSIAAIAPPPGVLAPGTP